MTTAYVLLTALPPTTGHMDLIHFAHNLFNVDNVVVVVTTQPSEPFANERYASIWKACKDMYGVSVEWVHNELEQNPEAPGFWEMWDRIMWQLGFTEGDYMVASEMYGKTMADRLNGVFMPYDPNRELNSAKATLIREFPDLRWSQILPEFRRHLLTRVTIFGAESTGKTTLSKALSHRLKGCWLFEYARPYLESVGPEITVESMHRIWEGQWAIQERSFDWNSSPYIIQDTDLYSTIGYWEQPHWTEKLGEVPEPLIIDAGVSQSDLYIITKSNIDFEPDPIRYGGDRRESPDEFWIGIAEKYNLNYLVLEASSLSERVDGSEEAIRKIAGTKFEELKYERQFN